MEMRPFKMKPDWSVELFLPIGIMSWGCHRVAHEYHHTHGAMGCCDSISWQLLLDSRSQNDAKLIHNTSVVITGPGMRAFHFPCLVMIGLPASLSGESHQCWWAKYVIILLTYVYVQLWQQQKFHRKQLLKTYWHERIAQQSQYLELHWVLMSQSTLWKSDTELRGQQPFMNCPAHIADVAILWSCDSQHVWQLVFDKFMAIDPVNSNKWCGKNRWSSGFGLEPFWREDLAQTSRITGTLRHRYRPGRPSTPIVLSLTQLQPPIASSLLPYHQKGTVMWWTILMGLTLRLSWHSRQIWRCNTFPVLEGLAAISTRLDIGGRETGHEGGGKKVMPSRSLSSSPVQ